MRQYERLAEVSRNTSSCHSGCHRVTPPQREPDRSPSGPGHHRDRRHNAAGQQRARDLARAGRGPVRDPAHDELRRLGAADADRRRGPGLRRRARCSGPSAPSLGPLRAARDRRRPRGGRRRRARRRATEASGSASWSTPWWRCPETSATSARLVERGPRDVSSYFVPFDDPQHGRLRGGDRPRRPRPGQRQRAGLRQWDRRPAGGAAADPRPARPTW